MRVLRGMVRANWDAGASACSSNYDCVGHPGGGSLGPKFCFFFHYHVGGKTSTVTDAVALCDTLVPRVALSGQRHGGAARRVKKPI